MSPVPEHDALQRGRPPEQAAAGVRVDPEMAPRALEALKAPKAVPAAGTCAPGSESQATCSAGQVQVCSASNQGPQARASLSCCIGVAFAQVMDSVCNDNLEHSLIDAAFLPSLCGLLIVQPADTLSKQG